MPHPDEDQGRGVVRNRRLRGQAKKPASEIGLPRRNVRQRGHADRVIDMAPLPGEVSASSIEIVALMKVIGAEYAEAVRK